MSQRFCEHCVAMQQANILAIHSYISSDENLLYFKGSRSVCQRMKRLSERADDFILPLGVGTRDIGRVNNDEKFCDVQQ